MPNRLRDIRKFCGSIPVVLVGNKTDVGAQWKEQTRSARIAFQQKRRLQHFESLACKTCLVHEEVERFMMHRDLRSFRTSAKTCYNLEPLA